MIDLGKFEAEPGKTKHDLWDIYLKLPVGRVWAGQLAWVAVDSWAKAAEFELLNKMLRDRIEELQGPQGLQEHGVAEWLRFRGWKVTKNGRANSKRDGAEGASQEGATPGTRGQRNGLR